MTEYVLGYAEFDDRVIFIEKQKPEWQKGRLNLPGGHIEPNESWRSALSREFEEEIGVKPLNIEFAGTIVSPSGSVVVGYCGTLREAPRTMTDEKVILIRREKASKSPFMIPNLRVIIPLIQNHFFNWGINHPDGDDNKFTVEFS